MPAAGLRGGGGGGLQSKGSRWVVDAVRRLCGGGANVAGCAATVLRGLAATPAGRGRAFRAEALASLVAAAQAHTGSAAVAAAALGALAAMCDSPECRLSALAAHPDWRVVGLDWGMYTLLQKFWQQHSVERQDGTAWSTPGVDQQTLVTGGVSYSYLNGFSPLGCMLWPMNTPSWCKCTPMLRQPLPPVAQSTLPHPRRSAAAARNREPPAGPVGQGLE